MYTGVYTGGPCSNAVNEEKKDVAFITTGKDVANVCFMEPGWGSLNGISHHISEFVDLSKNKISDVLSMVKDDRVRTPKSVETQEVVKGCDKK